MGTGFSSRISDEPLWTEHCVHAPSVRKTTEEVADLKRRTKCWGVHVCVGGGREERGVQGPPCLGGWCCRAVAHEHVCPSVRACDHLGGEIRRIGGSTPTDILQGPARASLQTHLQPSASRMALEAQKLPHTLFCLPPSLLRASEACSTHAIQ